MRSGILQRAFQMGETKPALGAFLERMGSLGERGFGFLRRAPWKRMLFWALVIGVLVLLRDYFDVIFLTFLFSYIMGGPVRWIERRFGRRSLAVRRLMVVGLYLFLLSGLTVAIWAAYPEIVHQGKSVLEKVGQAPAAQQLNRPPEKGLAAPVAKASPAKTEELWSRERVEGLLTQVLGTDRMERFKK